MNVLISTLKEEMATVKRLEKKYLAKINELPKGGFITRTVRGRKYGYLTYREDGKVKQRYLGLLDDKTLQSYRLAIVQRIEYKRKLKSVREQKKIINRALRGKTK